MLVELLDDETIAPVATTASPEFPVEVFGIISSASQASSSSSIVASCGLVLEAGSAVGNIVKFCQTFVCQQKSFGAVVCCSSVAVKICNNKARRELRTKLISTVSRSVVPVLEKKNLENKDRASNKTLF